MARKAWASALSPTGGVMAFSLTACQEIPYMGRSLTDKRLTVMGIADEGAWSSISVELGDVHSATSQP